MKKDQMIRSDTLTKSYVDQAAMKLNAMRREMGIVPCGSKHLNKSNSVSSNYLFLISHNFFFSN